MPRKANYRYDYDDDYDDYEYDDDDSVHVEQGEAVASQEAVKPEIWRCSICTYDNDESMTCCDICGVFRFRPSNSGSGADNETVPFKFDVSSPDDAISSRLNTNNKGGVLCHPDYPIRVASHMELKIVVLDVKVPILISSQFHIHHAKEAARVVRIVSLLDPKTGKETKKAPRCLVAKQNAVIEVALQGAVCVEDYANFKALGRVFLRSSGKTVVVGVVTRVMEDQK